MKTIILRAFLCFALAAAFPTRAQTYAEIYSFAADSTNSGGTFPYARPVLSGDTLYGTTYVGGTNGFGVIYSVHTDGSQYTDLHSFGKISTASRATNSDGATSTTPLILVSNVLYGTAYAGGAFGIGTVFRLDTDGSHFTNLHSFSDGSGQPRSCLISSNNVLFGSTYGGGIGYGSIYRLNTDGTGFTNLYSFNPASLTYPVGDLLLTNGLFYGTATEGGTNDNGGVYSVDPNGEGFIDLFSFGPGNGTNQTGYGAFSGVVLAGSRLYGGANYGGTNAGGVLFSVTTNGTGFTNLHNFSGQFAVRSQDGEGPNGRLLLIGDAFYGTTIQGGEFDRGAIFTFNTDGSGFTNIYFFATNFNSSNVITGGDGPDGGLIISGSTLYGTTFFGGATNGGNIYSLTLTSPASGPPTLNFQIVNNTLVLSWGDPSFALQTAATLTNSFTNIPAAPSPYTNAFSDQAQFFRLKQN